MKTKTREEVDKYNAEFPLGEEIGGTVRLHYGDPRELPSDEPRVMSLERAQTKRAELTAKVRKFLCWVAMAIIGGAAGGIIVGEIFMRVFRPH